MHEVVIAGLGQTPVGEHWELSLRELGFNAMEAAKQDSGGMLPQGLFVGNMLAPALSRQSHLATLIADFAGLRGIEAHTIESGGASGGSALRIGYLAVASGALDSVMVLGVEKMSDQTTAIVNSAVSTTTDGDYEAEQGLTLTSQAALIMNRYIHEYDVPEYAFGGFPIIAHTNGAMNQNAMFRRAIKPETYQKAVMVSEPLNMFDVAPYADGAAALLLTRPKFIPTEFPHPLITIAGSSAVTDTLALHDRQNPLEMKASKTSTENAIKEAGINIEDIDLFELYDAYSIYAALSMEAAGFSEPGKGWEWAKNGDLSLTGKMPISTFGGLKARGNPGGATGVYQALEACLQLRQQAGKNQVENAKYALVQSLGGPAATSVSHVLHSAQ